MMEVVIRVEAPMWRAQGVKESLAMAAEEYGVAHVVSVRDTTWEPAPNTQGGNDNGTV